MSQACPSFTNFSLLWVDNFDEKCRYTELCQRFGFHCGDMCSCPVLKRDIKLLLLLIELLRILEELKKRSGGVRLIVAPDERL
jgi:hypothetical protein